MGKIIDRAVAWALAVANDSSHGYDQTNRQGPDYDCSSLIINAFQQAGINVKGAGASYTGNMRSAFCACGFKWLPASVARQKGDILLHERNHTALCISTTQIVHAAGNENGGATGGKTGDQTGREIYVANYYTPSYGWDGILRYADDDETSESTTNTSEKNAGSSYVVQSGDTLYGIAQAYGTTVDSVAALNGISNPDLIYAGQTLMISGKAKTEQGTNPTVSETTCTVELPVLSEGSSGQAVVAMQTLLELCGYGVGPDGCDGDFGANTGIAVEQLQNGADLTADGVCGAKTWKALIG